MNGKRTRALELILEGVSYVDVGQACQVSERTVRRWAGEPGFRAELSRRNGERLADVSRQLSSIAGQAAYTLQGVMCGDIKGAGANVRRLAAVSVLELALKVSERLELEERLAAVEGRLGIV